VSAKFRKEAAEVLDYRFDFKPLTNGRDSAQSDFLGASETISSFTISADTGITVDSSALADTSTSVLVWLSGGTLGSEYEVVAEVVTSDSRKVRRSILIKIVSVGER